MAIDPKQQPQPGTSTSDTQRSSNTQKGIVTVNDENNPPPEERDAQIPNEPATERLRSERQSVQEGKRSE